MSNNQMIPEQLQLKAELVVDTFKRLFGISLDFSAESVRSIETYLEVVREFVTDDHREDLVTALGAYLGECLIRSSSAVWSDEQGWWGIKLGEDVFVCPFVQVRNQLTLGIDESVARYFDCVRQLSCYLQLQQQGESSMLNDDIQHVLRSELEYWKLRDEVERGKSENWNESLLPAA